MSEELVTVVQLPDVTRQLQVVVEIDSQKLGAEIARHTAGQASLKLAIDKLDVNTDEKQVRAVKLRNDAAGREKNLAAIIKRYKDPINAVRAQIISLEKETVSVFNAMKEEANRKINTYIRNQEVAARELQRKIEQAQEEQQRIAEREARELTAKGFVKQAEAKQHIAEVAKIPIILPKATQPIAGNRTTPTLKGRCEDIRALCRAIADGTYPLEHEVKNEMRPIVVLDQVVLNAIVSRQGVAAQVPGCVVEDGFRSSPTKL